MPAILTRLWPCRKSVAGAQSRKRRNRSAMPSLRRLQRIQSLLRRPSRYPWKAWGPSCPTPLSQMAGRLTCPFHPSVRFRNCFAPSNWFALCAMLGRLTLSAGNKAVMERNWIKRAADAHAFRVLECADFTRPIRDACRKRCKIIQPRFANALISHGAPGAIRMPDPQIRSSPKPTLQQLRKAHKFPI